MAVHRALVRKGTPGRHASEHPNAHPGQVSLARALQMQGTYPSVVKLHDGDEDAGPEQHAVQPAADVVDPLVEVRLLRGA